MLQQQQHANAPFKCTFGSSGIIMHRTSAPLTSNHIHAKSTQAAPQYTASTLPRGGSPSPSAAVAAVDVAANAVGALFRVLALVLAEKLPRKRLKWAEFFSGVPSHFLLFLFFCIFFAARNFFLLAQRHPSEVLYVPPRACYFVSVRARVCVCVGVSERLCACLRALTPLTVVAFIFIFPRCAFTYLCCCCCCCF